MKRLLSVLLLFFIPLGLTACLSDAESKYNSGTEKFNAKDIEGALADFNEAIRLDPNLALAYLNRGAVYISKGAFDAGIADETKALELKLPRVEDTASAHTNRAVAYASREDYDKAIADANEAIKLKADYAKAYFARGGSYANKGDKEAAIADFNKVLELSKDSEEGKAAQQFLTQLQSTP